MPALHLTPIANKGDHKGSPLRVCFKGEGCFGKGHQVIQTLFDSAISTQTPLQTLITVEKPLHALHF